MFSQHSIIRRCAAFAFFFSRAIAATTAARRVFKYVLIPSDTGTLLQPAPLLIACDRATKTDSHFCSSRITRAPRHPADRIASGPPATLARHSDSYRPYPAAGAHNPRTPPNHAAAHGSATTALDTPLAQQIAPAASPCRQAMPFSPAFLSPLNQPRPC